ncbi:hypothetical protein XMM379_001607 [Aliiroseovarius sp. xm-m-379]|uniref:NfeD family protein n=1 Tax=Aliiroseovarius TaxID=1658781 RepID=UPI0015692D05|nr:MULTISPECIES: hypothetical protein [Aliiroseovarius]NRP13710.1 hypothetical protein [Aliiroseovarius sp. xm-d-517]NRP24918.1 hypothetical protein [Aliiroseovarius sp. xm-m-379]NRP31560.1 hypothetical protein [Aliiroseovarius sp. xm-m-314]NRP33717.1 hypothetical protein [Aliiroseovarius sp. xm-a-104]NRP41150.1 hypothetical protein [Aliiroseovarius sp. xm-m-339-2]
MLWHEWWVWAAGAIGLVILEIFVPGFVFLGFAAGAAVVALLTLIGPSIGLPALLVIFGAVSVIAWLIMRRAFGVRDGQSKSFDRDINE